MLTLNPSFLTPTTRSALSDTLPSPSQTPIAVASPADSDEEDVFTYPADHYNGGDEHHDNDDQEEEFVYPDDSLDASTHQHSLIVSDGLPEHPLDPQSPRDSALESTIVAEKSPSLRSSPRAPSRPSPAQLEALSAAASQGDLALLKKLFITALQSGKLEAFALANDASSRTGFTALHAAASRGYLDIVEWRESWLAF